MGYGALTPAMIASLRPHVEGKVVLDIGAGDGELAQLLVSEHLGASFVHAVDKLLKPNPFPTHANIQWHERTTFYDLCYGAPRCPKFDVAFVSWPANHALPGLIDLCQQAQKVVYLGRNYQGNACGFREFFLHLLGRELLSEIGHLSNSMVIVGQEVPEPRKPTFEEHCGLSWESLVFWQERFNYES